MADIIDGKLLASRERGFLQAEIKRRKLTPHLAIVLVGEDAASHLYVKNKIKAANEAGIRTTLIAEPGNLSQKALLARLSLLSIDPAVHGIILQLPLPAHLDRAAAIAAINPLKDVDGLTSENQGLLLAGQPRFVPCTPAGCVRLIRTVQKDLTGLNAVIVGRSQIVGNPLAQLLLRENCTVTIAHSATRDLAAHTKMADILIVAAGKPGLITGDMIKPGAIVIDVGINHVDGSMVGDVDFASAEPVARAITPVPGGVGPMTIASLLENTVYAATQAR